MWPFGDPSVWARTLPWRRVPALVVTIGSGFLLAIPLPSPPIPTKVLPTALPTLPPLPLPTSVPTAVPSVPTLPTSLPSVPTVGLPINGTPTPGTVSGTPAPATAQPVTGSTPAGQPVAPASSGIGGWPIPVLSLPPGPVGVALAIGLLFLPLLLGIWLLLLARTIAAGARLRSASLRLNVAGDLGISPRELVAMSAGSLARVRDEVAVDELTGVLRRSAGVAALERELARARRKKHPLVTAFVDVDGLKKMNDTQGHNAGDALLHEVAAVLRSRLRADDVIFRYGGDEFVCILSESSVHHAYVVFEEMLATARSRGRGFSYGLALAKASDDAVTLLGRADQALYAEREARRAAGQQVDWREGRRRPISA
jgi:diguanylate cyclase (GGDEF)-like protein